MAYTHLSLFSGIGGIEHRKHAACNLTFISALLEKGASMTLVFAYYVSNPETAMLTETKLVIVFVFGIAVSLLLER